MLTAEADVMNEFESLWVGVLLDITWENLKSTVLDDGNNIAIPSRGIQSINHKSDHRPKVKKFLMHFCITIR